MKSLAGCVARRRCLESEVCLGKLAPIMRTTYFHLTESPKLLFPMKNLCDIPGVPQAFEQTLSACSAAKNETEVLHERTLINSLLKSTRDV